MANGAGVIIGRFQVDELTGGQASMLFRTSRHHDKVVVLLGVSAKLSTKYNPLNYEARAHMIQEHWDVTTGKSAPHKRLVLAPLPDRATDALWSKQIDGLLDSLLGPMTVKTLYGGRDSCLYHYKGSNEVGDIRTDAERAEEREFKDEGSGTAERERCFEAPPMTEAGRAGAIWAVGNQQSRLDPCVDMAVTHRNPEDKLMVLMGRKHYASGKFCFPGGHIENSDGSAEFAASRELSEETNLAVDREAWKYVCQVSVDDWRNVVGAHTWSTLYWAEYDINPNDAIAGDDLDEVEWIGLYDTPIEQISATHRPMFLKLREYLR